VRRLTKDRFRFEVGTSGKYYSAAWFAHGKKNGYYVGARDFGGSMKISLHDDWNCRLAFTKEGMAAMKQQGFDVPDNRAFVEWYRKPAPEEGANHVLSLNHGLSSPAPCGSQRYEACPDYSGSSSGQGH